MKQPLMSVDRLDGLCPKLELTATFMAQLRSDAGDECDELPLRPLGPHAMQAHGYFVGAAGHNNRPPRPSNTATHRTSATFEHNDVNHIQWYNILGKTLDTERACIVALEGKVARARLEPPSTRARACAHAAHVHMRHTRTLAHARTPTPWQVDATFKADDSKNDIVWDDLIKDGELSSYTNKMLTKMLKKIIKLNPKKPWVIGANANDDIGEISWTTVGTE